MSRLIQEGTWQINQPGTGELKESRKGFEREIRLYTRKLGT